MTGSYVRRSGAALGPANTTKTRIDLPITPTNTTPSASPPSSPADLATPLVRLDGTVPCEDKRYDPDLWYSELSSDIALASAICNKACSQLATCLAGAYERNEPFGVFGGLSARQRRINSGLEDDPDDDVEAEEQAADRTRYDMWTRGMTDLQIAATLDVTHNSIQKWRARKCLPPNGVRGRRPADADADVERRTLYEQGFSDKQIAEQLDMRTQAITRWRKRAGLSRHHNVESPGRVSA